MPADPVDPRWPKLLSLTVHEFRTPMTVVSGYLRMLLKERAGTITDQQRRLLEEAEKSCSRLSALLAEVSDLSRLEGGAAAFNRSRLDLRAVLRKTVAGLPPLPDRDIAVGLDAEPSEAPVDGDAARLEQALAAVIGAIRREIVSGEQLIVRERARVLEGRTVSWIAIADPTAVDALAGTDPASLGTFDEWRGGVGLSLAVARRIIGAHDGRIWSPDDADGIAKKTGAVIAIPHG